MDVKNIQIADYNYDLPMAKIAFEPLIPKDSSKLLVYQNQQIIDDQFTAITNYLPANSLLVFNNSKVIPARLPFYNSTGACIEIFLLEPIHPNKYETAFGVLPNNTCEWKCFIGNVKKWKTDNLVLQIDSLACCISVGIQTKSEDAYTVTFSWDKAIAFAEIIEAIGKIPLPPYIKRDALESDKITYQTIYAKHDGSVAAPTAGLHFTENVMQQLSTKSIDKAQVTLHVGAGTFKPVKAQQIGEHAMHSEYFTASINLLQAIANQQTITAVGTTSCRSLESLYWLGVKLSQQPSTEKVLTLLQWEVYTMMQLPTLSVADSMQQLLNYCATNNLAGIEANTQIIIAPGYKFAIVNNLITNFHQPQSTLLLLIAAFLQDCSNNKNTDWKTIYNHALQNNYRFLSYGDSSILCR